MHDILQLVRESISDMGGNLLFKICGDKQKTELFLHFKLSKNEGEKKKQNANAIIEMLKNKITGFSLRVYLPILITPNATSFLSFEMGLNE